MVCIWKIFRSPLPSIKNTALKVKSCCHSSGAQRSLACCNLLVYYLISTDIVRTMLILSGNVHEHSGPTDCNLKFFHWNLDSITTARENTKISLIEAYNSVFSYDLITISDTRLDRSISNEGIQRGGSAVMYFAATIQGIPRFLVEFAFIMKKTSQLGAGMTYRSSTKLLSLKSHGDARKYSLWYYIVIPTKLATSFTHSLIGFS